ncbi:hypothetical protein [Streptomyces sp. NBC_01216]|uniref:hypothetical protein n=1 Tax=unclassified Streptomyces TaxID=2593676 RepID=UPI002E10AB3D|nr:hypothetical protein OG393_24210 [Streptomyces sp. NBC_01216]
MSASDQDTTAPTATGNAVRDTDATQPEESSSSGGKPAAGERVPAGAGEPAEAAAESADEAVVADTDGVRAGGATPRQARRLRVAAASVLLVAMAVVLVIRLASRTSVLVVGVYGLAMILCGVVIELSRNGRTRLGTWLLVGGLAAALAFDWLILP